MFNIFCMLLTVLYKVYDLVFYKTLIEIPVFLRWLFTMGQGPGCSGSQGYLQSGSSSTAIEDEQGDLCEHSGSSIPPIPCRTHPLPINHNLSLPDLGIIFSLIWPYQSQLSQIFPHFYH